MRRALAWTLWALCLAGLGLLLRHDLALWSWRLGAARLATADYGAGVALLDTAGRLGADPCGVRFDTAVAQYRLGRFTTARVLFARCAAGAPRWRGAALYNLGNCAYREAEQVGAPGAAARLLRQAVAHYQQALELDPQARDARHNLALARARLALLAPEEAAPRGEGDGRRGGETGRGERPSDTATAKAGAPVHGADPPGSGPPGDAGEPGRVDAPAGGRDGDGRRAGAAVPRLSRTEAEAVLDEARGREGVAAALRGSGAALGQGRPERDW